MGFRANKEVEILRMLDHPRLIKLIDIYGNPEEMAIVTELCPGTDLNKMI